MLTFRAAALAALLAIPSAALAHPGGLNAEGCHNDRRNGTYHCHRAPAGGGTRPAVPAAGFAPGGTGATHAVPRGSDGGAVYYPNCAAVRAAGKAPIRRGQPGYAAHLDRDSDGVGCE